LSSTAISLLDLLRRTPLVEKATLDAWLLDNSGAARQSAETVAQAMVRDNLLTRFQAEQILRGRGKLLVLRNKYLVLDLLGSGGMGKVYLCRHLLLDRLVAVKMLPASKVNDPEIVERFTNEARVVAALRHRNIIQVYDIEIDERMPLMVMEYAEGSDLDRVVRRHGPLDPDTAAHFISQAACGLQNAMENELVHRDIKPSNLLLDRYGVVRVLDMGLARFLNRDTGPSITRKYNETSILGTADYLSPEQAMSSNVDIRADIYSLGATFHFLLTGKPPFDEEGISQKLMAHQMKPVPSLIAAREDVPREMDLIFRTMLAKNPDDRFRTPMEVVRALSPFAVRAQDGMHDTIERLLGKSLIARGATVSASFDVTGSDETIPLGRSSSTMPIEPRHPPRPSRSRVGIVVACGLAILGGFSVAIWQLTAALTPSQEKLVATPLSPPVPKLPTVPPVAVAATRIEPVKDAIYTPEDAAGLIDAPSATFKMFVADARGDEKAKIDSVWLSSSTNPTAARTLRVAIGRATWEESEAAIKFDALPRHFYRHTIIVTGKVSLRNGRYELAIDSAGDIRRVD